MAELMATIVSNLGVNCYMTSLPSTRYLRYKFHGFHDSSACNGKVKEGKSSQNRFTAIRINRSLHCDVIRRVDSSNLNAFPLNGLLWNALKKTEKNSRGGKIEFAFYREFSILGFLRCGEYLN